MSSKEEALRRLQKLEERVPGLQKEHADLMVEKNRLEEKVELLEDQIGKMMVEIDRYKDFTQKQRELRDTFAAWLGLAEAKSLSDIKNEILDEVKKSLPNISSSQSSPEALEVTKSVPRLDVTEHRPTIKADDSKDTLGRLGVIIDDGWWDDRHNVKQVVEEFSNRGWSDERKEIEANMVKLCEMKLLYRKISTGNIMWYELTKDAKERVKKKVKE